MEARKQAVIFVLSLTEEYKPTFFSPQRQITIFLGFALN